MKKVYLDYAASTPVDKKVFKKMKKYFLSEFSNAGAIHDGGREIKKVIEECRNNIKKILDAKNSKEIIFTSGGTESNALAIKGYIDNFLKNNPGSKLNLFTSKLEHPSVIKVFELYKKTHNLELIDVKQNGQIDVDDFRSKFENSKGDNFVSFMYVNNETGVIQPIKEVSRIIKKSSKNKNTVFHTDACQAPLYLTLNVNSLGVDMMSLCSQKIYGPKGSGALFVKNSIKIEPIFSGGKQENGKRAGTENTSLIVGFTESLKVAQDNINKYSFKNNELKEKFLDSILEKGVIELNGQRDIVLPHAINLSFLKTNKSSEQIVLYLNSKGIMVSSKSACMGSNEKNSEVIESMIKDRPNSIRFCFGSQTKKRDVKYLIKVLKELK